MDTTDKDAEIARLAAEVEKGKKKEEARRRRRMIVFKVFMAAVWLMNGVMWGGLTAKFMGA